MNGATCAAPCLFYSPKEGQCRAEPPRVFIVPMQTVQGPVLQPASLFPTVEPSAWCGAFEPVDMPEAADDKTF